MAHKTTLPEIDFSQIPLVDLGPWWSKDEQKRLDVAHRVNSVCRQVGFLYISNHGVEQDLIDRIFAMSERFFALSVEEKRQVDYRKTGKHRGYIELMGESTDPQGKPDLKEAFDCGLVISAEHCADEYMLRRFGVNLWPENISGFRAALEEYLSAVHILAQSLFEIFALGFGLPERFFADRIDRPMGQLRILHYPPQELSGQQGVIGIGEHCDYECFTILAQGEHGGLQVKNHAGAWVAAPPVTGTFVVNIGEMLARWTNDEFLATPHRVINESGHERFSVPFFFATNYDCTIEPIPGTFSVDNPPRYEPVVAGRYLAERLQSIYGA